MRAVKIRAVHENRKLKEMVAQLLEVGLASESPPPVERRRVKFPLIDCGETKIGRDLTPEELAEVLNDEEAKWHLDLSPNVVRR